MACALLLLVGGSAALQWTTEAYPANCGEHHHVCDPDGLLSRGVRGQIASQLATLQSESLHDCGGVMRGYQVGVALLESFEGEDISSWSKRLMDRWGVGNRACNDGVLFVLARSDRKNHIATGRGARQKLSDRHASDILTSLRPLLRAGELDKAVLSAVEQVIAALRSEREPLFYTIDRYLLGLPSMARDEPAAFIFWSAMISMFSGIWLSSRRKRLRRQGFERKLRQLEAAQARLAKRQDVSGGDCRHAPCPICLDELVGKDGARPNFEGGAPVEHGIELLKCGHTFHSGCIDTWLRKSGAKTCPVCRQAEPRIDGRASTLPRVKPPSDSMRYAFHSLTSEYGDVPGVTEMRRRIGGSRGMDAWDSFEGGGPAGLYRSYEDSRATVEAAEAAAAAARAEAARSQGGDGGGGGSSWGGGSSDGGGGASGSW